MSPYIVTVKREEHHVRAIHNKWLTLSVKAVATLDEAGSIALDAYEASTGLQAGGPTADKFTEFGGTVGPLPDGTVIEVAPTVSWGGAPIGMARWLREEQGWSIPASMDDAAAIDAYNDEAHAP